MGSTSQEKKEKKDNKRYDQNASDLVLSELDASEDTDSKNPVWFLPWLENIVVFVVLVLFEVYFSHPWWVADLCLLYVGVFSFVYGQRHTDLSVVLSCALLLSRYQMDTLNVCIACIRIVLTGFAIGYLKSKAKRVEEACAEQTDYLEDRLEQLAKINMENVRIKKQLEITVVNEKNTAAGLTRLLTSFIGLNKEAALEQACIVFGRIAGTKNALLLDRREDGSFYERGSGQMREIGGPVQEDLVVEGCFVNREARKDYPDFAIAFQTGNQLSNVIELSGVPWEKMTYQTLCTLREVQNYVQCLTF